MTFAWVSFLLTSLGPLIGEVSLFFLSTEPLADLVVRLWGGEEGSASLPLDLPRGALASPSEESGSDAGEPLRGGWPCLSADLSVTLGLTS